MAEVAEDRRNQPVGSERPRVAPPTPARTAIADFKRAAEDCGIKPWPHQLTAARYVYALGQGDAWLYPEVATIIARQNGKSEFLVPHVIARLRAGRRILHAAQTRDLPRIFFVRVAPIVERLWPKAVVRRGAGQETIEVPETGGFYKIAAATAGGPRGWTADDLLLDEVRELEEDFIGAVLPTTVASLNPQILYLSNAGHDDTRALNNIRLRAGEDPSLAYLEWSADPAYATDDVQGWLQANPAIGHNPGLLGNLTRLYRSHKLAGTLAQFETENLCRWVATMRERLVDEYDWVRCKVDSLEAARRPAYGVSMDPEGKRASIAVAWQTDTGIGLQMLVNDQRVDIGDQLKSIAGPAAQVGYDPLTDGELAKFVRKGKGVPISGGKFANASALFVTSVREGRLQWVEADAVTDDLTWTARKNDGSSAGSYHAVRAQDDRPITAALAAIRAVWLASGPASSGPPRIR